jgi:hypothetical protein
VRSFIGRIEIPADEGKLMVFSAFARILATAGGERNGSAWRPLLRVVAGARNQRYLRLWSEAA